MENKSYLFDPQKAHCAMLLNLTFLLKSQTLAGGYWSSDVTQRINVEMSSGHHKELPVMDGSRELQGSESTLLFCPNYEDVGGESFCSDYIQCRGESQSCEQIISFAPGL